MIRATMIFFFLILVARAQACQSAKLRFEGTAFAKTALQMEGDKIYFFRSTPRELSISYYPRKKQWCYLASEASSDRPRQGCMGRKLVDGKNQFVISGQPARAFTIRDVKQRPVATVSVLNNLLTVNFIGTDQKPLGKRLVFKSVSRDNLEWLEVKGWNCPNPRYLSCAGAELTSVTSFEGESALIPKVREAELSKPLGHYRLSCDGLIESASAQ